MMELEEVMISRRMRCQCQKSKKETNGYGERFAYELKHMHPLSGSGGLKRYLCITSLLLHSVMSGPGPFLCLHFTHVSVLSFPLFLSILSRSRLKADADAVYGNMAVQTHDILFSLSCILCWCPLASVCMVTC